MAIRRVSDLPELTSIYPQEDINGKKCLIETSYAHGDNNRYQSFYTGLDTAISIGLNSAGFDLNNIVMINTDQIITGKKTFTNANGIYIQPNGSSQPSNIRQVTNNKDDIKRARSDQPYIIPTIYAIQQLYNELKTYVDNNITNLQTQINNIKNDIINLQNQINAINASIADLTRRIQEINDKINADEPEPEPEDDSNSKFPDYTSPLEFKVPKNQSKSMTPPIDIFIATKAGSSDYTKPLYFDTTDRDVQYPQFKNTGAYIRAGTTVYYKYDSNGPRTFYVYPILDGNLNDQDIASGYVQICAGESILTFLNNLHNNITTIQTYFKEFRIYGRKDGVSGGGTPSWNSKDQWGNVDTTKWTQLFDRINDLSNTGYNYNKIQLVCAMQNNAGIIGFLRARTSKYSSTLKSQALSPTYQKGNKAYSITIASVGKITPLNEMADITFILGNLKFENVNLAW